MSKFSKSYAPIKKNVKTQKKIRVGENVSVIIQRKLPQKYKNLGMFTIPYVIGNHKLEGLCLI
jgi:acyl-ACP thioesterase